MAPTLVRDSGCCSAAAPAKASARASARAKASLNVGAIDKRHFHRRSSRRTGGGGGRSQYQQQQQQQRRGGVLVLAAGASGQTSSQSSSSSSPPKVHYHLVKPGESLYSIADKYSVSISSLRRANGISDRQGVLYVDAQIVVPGGAPSRMSPIALCAIGVAAAAAVTVLIVRFRRGLQGIGFRRRAVAFVQSPREDRRRREEKRLAAMKRRENGELDDDEEYHYPLTDGYWVKHPSGSNGLPSASTFVWGSHSSNPFFAQGGVVQQTADQQSRKNSVAANANGSSSTKIHQKKGRDITPVGKTRPYTSSSLAEVFAEQLELLETMLEENLTEMDELKDGAASRISSSAVGNGASRSDFRGLVAADCLFQAAALREAMEDSLRHLDDAEDFLKDQLETLRDATLNQYLARMSKLMEQAQQNLKELEYLSASGAFGPTPPKMAAMDQPEHQHQELPPNGSRKVQSPMSAHDDLSIALQRDFEEMKLLQKDGVGNDQAPVEQINGFDPGANVSHSRMGRRARSILRKPGDGK